MGLTLSAALRLCTTHAPAESPGGGHSVAFVGAGGKSTAIFKLARELAPPVVITSTTHFGDWQTGWADRHVTAQSVADVVELGDAAVTLVTGPTGKDGRTQPVDSLVLDWLQKTTASRGWPLLIEADGSRQKPLKAPAEHEPNIPDFVEMVVVLAGLSALGKPLSEEIVHRAALYSSLCGLRAGSPISTAAMVRVLAHAHGGLKNMPGKAHRVALLNQADTPEAQSVGREMAAALLPAFESVIVSSLEAPAVYAVHESCSGVVLAAGEGSRFGKSKQLLDWRGQPFVRAVARVALDSGLAPVVVVLGAEADRVGSAVADLPVVLARNESWREGQASSIRTGLAACPQTAGSAVFLLADQPQVTSAVIRSLVELHSAELAPIVAPLILEERRGNPVLFDRTTFADLLNLRGDSGGRELFSKHPVRYLPWHDASLLLDVDTEDDYRLLQEGSRE